MITLKRILVIFPSCSGDRSAVGSWMSAESTFRSFWCLLKAGLKIVWKCCWCITMSSVVSFATAAAVLKDPVCMIALSPNTSPCVNNKTRRPSVSCSRSSWSPFSPYNFTMSFSSV